MMCDAKSYLQQIRLCDTNINSRLEELDRLKDLTVKITSAWSQEPGGGGTQDKLGEAVARIVDLEHEINQAIDEYADKRKEVSAVIDKVRDATQAAVLRKRYLEGKKWEQIALDMNYSYQGVCKIHGRALQTVEKILKKSR